MAYIQLPIAEAPQDPGIYRERAARIVEHGYTGVTQAAIATLHR